MTTWISVDFCTRWDALQSLNVMQGPPEIDSKFTFVCWIAAQAILPTQDDEDEELINKAKSGRKARIQSELTTEKTFSKENYNDMAILTVARAVKKIAKSGEQLEKGDLKGVAAQVG